MTAPTAAGNQLIADTAANADLGRPTARKAGRTSARPYVPVIAHTTGGIGGGPHTAQIVGLAYPTAEEATARAASEIARRRRALERRLGERQHRALRESYGLPSELEEVGR